MKIAKNIESRELNTVALDSFRDGNLKAALDLFVKNYRENKTLQSTNNLLAFYNYLKNKYSFINSAQSKRLLNRFSDAELEKCVDDLEEYSKYCDNEKVVITLAGLYSMSLVNMSNIVLSLIGESKKTFSAEINFLKGMAYYYTANEKAIQCFENINGVSEELRIIMAIASAKLYSYNDKKKADNYLKEAITLDKFFRYTANIMDIYDDLGENKEVIDLYFAKKSRVDKLSRTICIIMFLRVNRKTENSKRRLNINK